MSFIPIFKFDVERRSSLTNSALNHSFAMQASITRKFRATLSAHPCQIKVFKAFHGNSEIKLTPDLDPNPLYTSLKKKVC
jgi:hypothetical protein